MPLTNAARIWAMKREAERSLAAKLDQQETRASQQALTVPIPLLPKLPPAGQRPPREALDLRGQHQGRAARQGVDQPGLGDREPDSDRDSPVFDDRPSAQDREGEGRAPAPE
jgi:hypothetical protein